MHNRDRKKEEKGGERRRNGRFYIKIPRIRIVLVDKLVE
jgi:hypothetical protein